MIKLRFLPRSVSGQRRYRLLFLLLAVHAVLVYAVSEFAVLSRGGLIWAVQRAPGRFDRQPEKVFDKDGRRYLWGGANNSDHFEITKFRLKPDQLHFGVGRERFAALIDPEFSRASGADEWIRDSQRVLAVKIDDDVKVYPLNVLRRHEVVNDVVGGRPIFAAYCVLADLGVVYDRRIREHTFTFAVSGYTYAEPDVWGGRDAFVLWDRDTESLWWPPIGKAVSGSMLDTPMKVLDSELWAQTTWGEVRSRYPNALVLKPGQDFDRPTHSLQRILPEAGPRPLDRESAPWAPDDPPENSIAPRWGKNPRLGAGDTSNG